MKSDPANSRTWITLHKFTMQGIIQDMAVEET
jgi:hypothetical protein